MSISMLWLILSFFIAAAIIPFIYRRRNTLSFLTILLIPFVASFYFIAVLRQVIDGNVIAEVYQWVPTIGVSLHFYLDGLSIFFATLISVFGVLVVMYSRSYMKHHERQGLFFGYLFLFMGSMLGIVLSVNLISLFLFWELTSISSFLLIGFDAHKKKSRDAAVQALLITSAGGFALLGAILILASFSPDNLDLTKLISDPTSLGDGYLKTASMILLVVAAMTKSAQFPFHFWLPNAMEAPTPVSAYLHAATMVKAGVYLILRMTPVFADAALWHDALTGVGAVSMCIAAWYAFNADDLKEIFAYATISALGIFFMMTGVGSTKAIEATMIYVAAHALYKGALFFVAGNIDQQTGTRKVSLLGNLSRKMPRTSAAALIACASMAGLPPLLGFVGKESLIDSLIHQNSTQHLIFLVALFFTSACFVAISADITYSAFFRKEDRQKHNVRDAPFNMTVPPIALGALTVVFGLLPHLPGKIFLSKAVTAIVSMPIEMNLKLWHGFNLVLLVSLLSIATGLLLFTFRHLIRKAWHRAGVPMNGKNILAEILRGLEKFSVRLTGIVQSGSLKRYTSTVVIFITILIVYLIVKLDLDKRLLSQASFGFENLEIYEASVFLLIVAALWILFTTHSRLLVVATIGLIGYGLAFLYTRFSAPDIAITQFLSDTLTMMMLILILHRLPSYTVAKSALSIPRMATAILFGCVMTILALLTFTTFHESPLKNFFLTNSPEAGHGENVVNVILVDFRAMDTLGEISVLTITMLGVIALLANPLTRER